ncbi:c-type cytochrome [Pseudaestuariivita atlantica]|uniref:Cytochrome C554 n=1 Tax=Pseudaestuariivita atlantica TaxID=1317121 RepID=A0A0L1JMW3_9RHOB|nr:cytochrome c [Pseudaestuariivita atlantica]KNG93047.1 hypothetical protein ATO11_14090 [Pseudaestuariivita atlantica]
MTFRTITTTTAAIGIAIATAAFSGGHASLEDQAIAARNAVMTLYGFNAGILGGMAKGDVAYDAASATAAAQNLAAAANMSQMHFWPEGTDNFEMEGKTRAKPEIWSNADDFATKVSMLADAATALAATAGDGQAALGAGMQEVGAACGACHKAYRGPRL